MAIAQKAATRQVAKATQARAVRPVVVRGAVKCQAQQGQQLAKKAAAAVASLPAMLAASPAFALVDDRLNGDGAGIALGVNEPILGWVIGGVATAIWIAYFIAQKDFGDFEDKDSGVGL
jgi:photosystem II PsbW protein